MVQYLFELTLTLGRHLQPAATTLARGAVRETRDRHSCMGPFTRYVGLGTGSTWWNIGWNFFKIYHHILV
jgi:hypothetical protein